MGENGALGNQRFLGSLGQRVTAGTLLGNAGDASYGQRAGLPRGPELGIKLEGVICLKREEAGEPHGRLSPRVGLSDVGRG